MTIQPLAATAPELLATTLTRLANLIEPPAGADPQTLSCSVRVVEAEGKLDELAGQRAGLAFQAPDRARLSVHVDGRTFVVGRNRGELWITAPEKHFGVLGSPEVPRFLGKRDTVEDTKLPPFKLPFDRRQLLLLPLACEVTALGAGEVAGQPCSVVQLTPRPAAASMIDLPAGECRLWIRDSDSLPVRIAVKDDDGHALTVEFDDLRLDPAHADAVWEPSLPEGSHLERVALAHLVRFLPAAISIFQVHTPTLGPVTGERRLLARSGEGRLEEQDGTKVLFLKGTPEEMGRQHGELLRERVHDLVAKVLYGVGVGSSFEKGHWFFGEIEGCQARIEPFIDGRYLREMDALAAAVDLDPQEVRLANFFPELFHCSGFAVWGQATTDGRLYHGRVLDYMKGVGLEPNAVVIIHQPDVGHAWANISYAGFVGSVTAMNERHISIGEMGGRGEGNWDGKPMAQLMREVMEKAGSLEEGLEIMRRGPRTCEYFYVLADGNQRRAVGIAATPETFEVIEAGMAHPRLPHAVPDAVLLSAGDRYEKLVARVTQDYGTLDAGGARHLMDRPVAMKSNIHSVLFAPETLDFWVANADSRDLAAHTRYTHYNLGELLREEAALMAQSSE
ncbi:MAG: hypothetical protein H7A46_23415 [Verrucomicrobiales bacterium]|nr:hypothetical protein [Verrucomicrobiales bacterium]